MNGAGTGAERELHRHLDRGRPDPSDRQERQPGGARNGHVGHPFGVTFLIGKTIRNGSKPERVRLLRRSVAPGLFERTLTRQPRRGSSHWRKPPLQPRLSGT
jgi:hypothetical protein